MTLLFQPEHIEAIRQGVKTQTRRDWAPNYPRPTPGSVRGAVTELFTPREKIDCWLRITDVWQEPLGAISEADARAEGGYSVPDFRDAWIEINGSWDPEQEVDVVAFEYVGREAPDA